ncbi:MAG: 3-deoxy-manno-octulosonate cytidylyltransferase [Alphaproteobacteria bacterium]
MAETVTPAARPPGEGRAIVLIPARLASTRLPGKPLADIAGLPMIVHVWRRAVEAGVGPVVVAAAEAEIVEAVMAAGGQAVLTAPDHPSGSDRIYEALTVLDRHARYPAIVNVQGDLPTLDPAVIRAALDALDPPAEGQPGWSPETPKAADMATVVADLGPGEGETPHVVKALVPKMDAAGLGRATDFVRRLPRVPETPAFHHIGLYAYRRPALIRFVGLPPSEREKSEKLEQLRALEDGMTINAAHVDTVPLGVDTPADLERARASLARPA